MIVMAPGVRWKTIRDSLKSCLMAMVCLLRGVPLLFAARPGTPLRVLAIVTFDLLHRHRTGRPLSADRCRQIAVLLDFGACANAFFDQKYDCRSDWLETLSQLEEMSLGMHADHYLRRLTELESTRPQPWGGDEHFLKVRHYREEVIRLSIAMVATTAHGNRRITEAVEATRQNGVLNLLFRIVMQCQIIDDLFDYSQDAQGGLPSFLTACQSYPRSLEQTRQAAHNYADNRLLAQRPELFPLRLALRPIFFFARLVLFLRRLRVRPAGKIAQEPV